MTWRNMKAFTHEEPHDYWGHPIGNQVMVGSEAAKCRRVFSGQRASNASGNLWCNDRRYFEDAGIGASVLAFDA